MKLQAELENVTNRFKEIQGKIIPYAKQLKMSNNYKDFETRLAWDCLHTTFKSSEICNWYDKYNCTDEHITTLAKQALKKIYPIN